jgi:hypothetical protein
MTFMRWRFILVVLVIALPSGCDQLVDPTPSGTYRYSSFDSSGTLLVQGWFTMDVADSDSVTGEWHFTAVGSPQRIGPQTGDGRLVGGIRDSILWIELQPQFRDNNLELAGKLAGDRYTGTWTWISFIGPTNSGRFEAEKE